MGEMFNMDNLRARHEIQEDFEFEEVSPEVFVECRDALSEKQKKYLSMYEPEELKRLRVQVFLSKNKKTGFGLVGHTLVNVFSLEKGNGKHSVIESINLGGRSLSCFDKEAGDKEGLPEYYAKFGFVEHGREKNWNEGEPDVVYMSLDPELEQEINPEDWEAHRTEEQQKKEASDALKIGDYSECSEEFIESMGTPEQSELERIESQ